MSARQFRRFIERVTRQGGADRCHGCGRTLSSGEVTLTGAGADGRGLTVAGCCDDRIVGLALGVYVTAPAVSEWGLA